MHARPVCVEWVYERTDRGIDFGEGMRLLELSCDSRDSCGSSVEKFIHFPLPLLIRKSGDADVIRPAVLIRWKNAGGMPAL